MNYTHRKISFCRSVRNLAYTNKSVDIDEIYVALDLSYDSNIIKESSFIDSILYGSLKQKNKIKRDAATAIVTGGAGSGKSMFMRKVYLALCNKNFDKIPVFVEACSIDGDKAYSLNEVLLRDLNSFGGKISSEQLEEGLNRGLFIVLIDGIDEINISLEAHYVKEILEFANRFDKCPIVLSGRPSEAMLGWREFALYEIHPLTMDGVLNLISKLNVVSDIDRKKFIHLIKFRLFRSHYDFLSNPLLATVMLLTYVDVKKISKRHHEFYDDAFNALWSRHDARKEGFERKKYSGLDKGDFLRVTSAFSASGYVSGDFQFRENVMMQHLENALTGKYALLSPKEFIKDLTISTSLLVKDGQFYTFIHRSFQEYFTALWAIQLADKECSIALDDVSDRYKTDNVLYFALAINDEKIERNWVIPLLNSLMHDMPEEYKFQEYSKYIKVRGSDLDKIRKLCGFKPSMSEILATIDAAREIGWHRMDALFEDEYSTKDPLHVDWKNFRVLQVQLKNKYRNRMTGVKAILAQVRKKSN